jgi:beta-ribofuranosylaminobenzene 5'-phosphate synthase
LRPPGRRLAHAMNALSPPPQRSSARARLGLRAPGRLHLGFVDPSGTLGRRFGSLGLVIEGFATELELADARTDALHADTPAAAAELPRAMAFVERLRDQTGMREPLHIRLRGVLPAHAGFGSGTQLALAVGRAFAAWHGLTVDTATLARWLGRGLRSGVGIAGFEQGGLLLDGGPGADGTPAPLLARHALPAEWRVIVVQDTSLRGLSGDQERRAISTLPPLPRAQAADLCHQVLMRVLPGAATADHALFAAGINALQERLGVHFAAAQGGSPWTSPAVARLLGWVRDSQSHPAAVGQSSWGPTGFAIVPSQAAAQTLLAAARAAGATDAALTLDIVAPRNHGAVLRAERPA